MHLSVRLGWFNSWLGCDEVREDLQKGGNKSGAHALGFEPVNQEQFEVFHEVDALYNKKGGLKSRSSKGHLTSEDDG
jgi:hypothetical protein